MSRHRDDLLILAGLAVFTSVLAAVTWKAWGSPQISNELTIADMTAHGHMPYRDVRYYYGPAGLYSLALAFKVFGTSYATAFGFGLTVTAGVLATFYALARHWLRPVFAGLVTAALSAIAFSGVFVTYALPHTYSVTVGLLFLLLALLALVHERPVLAGIAAGVVGLTRPEFAGAAALALVGFVAGTALASGWRSAGRAALRVGIPALAVVAAGFAPFVAAVGVHDLVTQNIFPVHFLKMSGLHAQKEWAPFSFASGVALVGRAAVYLGLLGGAVASALLWDRYRGIGRLKALWPLAAAAGALLVVDIAAHVIDVFPGTRSLIQTEVRRRLLEMSWLPALAIGAAVWAVISARRGKRAPLSGSWPVDLALIGAALVLGGRAYNRFTTDVYGAYYAAPVLLLAGILHQWIADRWPSARLVAIGALAVVVGALALNVVQDTRVESFTVKTPRGSYRTTEQSGVELQRTVDYLRAHGRIGEEMVDLPSDGGLYFAAGMRPALYDAFVFPGTIESGAQETATIARLRAHNPRWVVMGNGRFVAWRLPRIGVDFNRRLVAAIHRRYRLRATFGDFRHRPTVDISDGFQIYERR
jgi:hypothetical protein